MLLNSSTQKNAFLFALAAFTFAALMSGCHTAGADSSDGYNFDASDSPEYVANGSLPFSRGLNFTTWFEAPSPHAIPFTKFTEQDFINAKNMGVEIIRLPINLHSMTLGASSTTLDPLFLQFLDAAVDWAQKHELYLILDNHSFDPVANTDPNIDRILIPVWTQLAQRYKDSSDYILYEILNEPHGIDAQKWGDIQGRAVAAIRAIDSRHYIIVGGVEFNSIDEMFNVPQYNYANIIYTFHFYDPYLFTHQGETWGSPPNLRTLKGVPFPADAHPLPELSAELKGTWVADSLRHSYRRDGTTQALARQLDKAARFSQERGDAPLLCGEFGVYIPNSLPADRLRWYQIVTKMLDNRNIARTSWDYFGGFGIFNTEKGGSFESDLNVDIVNAMGFTPPPQKPAQMLREGFALYDQYPSSQTDIHHWSCDLDLYYQNGQKYAISWGNVEQYGTFFFNFRQEIDWEYLKSQGYAITLRVRSSQAARFHVRFVNREGGASIPWRIFTELAVAADGEWHTVRLPLSQMQEHGAWISDKQQWRTPEGKFSWAAVESLAFVAEDGELKGSVLFDTIALEK